MLKKVHLLIPFFLIFCFSATLFGNDVASTYFPNTPGTVWVYEDQDGNEITREVAEDKVLPGETFHAFSYEPAIKDWFGFIPHFQPSRFRVSEKGIEFYVSKEIQKAIKARLTREFETIIKDAPLNDADVTCDVVASITDKLFVLPMPVSFTEEWDTGKLNATLNVKSDGDRLPFNFTVFEPGKVVGKETIELPAGTFTDCLKIQFRTETELQLPFNEMGENPPDETVTTLWLAPNVGIVKCHREMEDMLLKAMSADASTFTTTIQTYELKEYEIKSDGSETKTDYFPFATGSFWVYLDQDGNELTRHAVEDEVIPDKHLNAFKYTPSIKKWDNFEVFAHPSSYQVDETGIKLHVGDEAAKAVRARLNKELDTINKILKRIQTEEKNNALSQRTTFDMVFKVDVKAQKEFNWLPNPIPHKSKWDVAKINAKIALSYVNTRDRDKQIDIRPDTWDFVIINRGKVVGTETVETSAGKFEDCLKIEYRTETTVDISNQWHAENSGPPGESVITVWLAPKVGIVKFHRESQKIFLQVAAVGVKAEPGITDADIEEFTSVTVKTLI